MEYQIHKNWFSRNWPWVIPASGCLTLIILGAIGIGVAFFKMPEILNNVEPVQIGIAKATTNDHLIEAIGKPIEVDREGEVGGFFNVKKENDEVDMVFPLRGPKGKALLIIKGKKTDGEWIYEEISATVKETDQKINLLDKSLEDL
jgi:hypothetical protein